MIALSERGRRASHVDTLSIVGLLERSETPFDEERFKSLLNRSKLAEVYGIEPSVVEASLERAKGAYNAAVFAELECECDTFEQRKAAWQFAGKCFSDLARKAVLTSVELFRAATCLVYQKDYRECVHTCAKCEDHFHGTDIEIDHEGAEFYQILVAFLDRYVDGWCIIPDRETVRNKTPVRGYRGRVQAAHKVDTAETESAYWQRVKRVSALRWKTEELSAKFVAFHNSAAKLQPLCVTCHDKKTRSWGHHRQANPVYIEKLGKSKKRKLDDESNRKVLEREATFLDTALVKDLVHGLRSAIASMQAADLVAALEKVPSELHDVLPMVKTAEQLLRDIELYEHGGARIELKPFPTDPYGMRFADISWEG
jgi:hypothetical protein